MAGTFSTIDDYISSFPQNVQVILDNVRRTIRDVVPAAEETISYQIPTFGLDGQQLVYFAGWKNHISVYPIPRTDEALEKELAPYQSGKGTLKFPLDKPIPYGLIEQVVRLLVRQHGTGRHEPRRSPGR